MLLAKSKSYEPPGNVRYPIGDEDMSTNILEKPQINELKERVSQQYNEKEFSTITHSYISVGNFVSQ